MTAAVPSQTSRYERKQEAVLEAAAKLFNARGLGGTTIAEVAQAVGLTTASVTYYYRKKEDLAAACLLRAIDVMDALVTEAEPAGSAPARLTRFLELYFAKLADVAEGRIPAMINFWDLRALTGPQAKPTMDAFITLFRRFRELLRDPAGPTFSRDEQNARAHVIFSAAIRSKGWVERYETEDYGRAAARAADILIHGLAGSGRAWSPTRLELGPLNTQDAGEVSREAFLRAATELVNEHGYRGASVDRISAKLNVTKGSFYHHNETKDDLVSACFGHTFEVMRRAHRAAVATLPDGWDRLCALSAALVRYQLSEHGPLLRLSALSAAVETQRPDLLAEFARLSEKTGGLIADGIADGSIRPVDPEIAAQLVTGMINAGAELSRWAPAANTENAADLFVKPLMLGVFSPS
ncbi:TetR/AcrR family transcriptional regulator [Caulobacter sp. S45]|uniref:TetR/AcrR family transcriptional regulator n=1 Tax=Caulobacter sp. S45 TaxID=1641861 RepID=UPI00131D30A1|nr:TetR/AcrR family transcriptional regulator [Caulobacter sp. S45]